MSLYDYVRGYSNYNTNMGLDAFVQHHDVARKWSRYHSDCLSVPGMIHVNFELVQSDPAAAFAVLQHDLGMRGYWNGSDVPSTGAVMNRGGRINGWTAMSNAVLRDFMFNISSVNTERCWCDQANHEHHPSAPCTPQMSPFENIKS